MPENAAIHELSAIARPLGEAARGGALPEGAAPLWEWFAPGQVLELSVAGRSPGERVPASARLSTAAQLVARAQAEGEPVVWIEGSLGVYPPDLASVGVDLEALVVVQPPTVGQGRAQASLPAVRAAEVLLRSGAFGLLVLDLSAGVPHGALGWLARLHGLLRLHTSRLLVVTGASEASLGPLVSLRVAPAYRRLSAERWALEHEVLKSKLGASVRIRTDVCAAPPGASGVGVGPRLSKRPAGVEHERAATERCA